MAGKVTAGGRRQALSTHTKDIRFHPTATAIVEKRGTSWFISQNSVLPGDRLWCEVYSAIPELNSALSPNGTNQG